MAVQMWGVEGTVSEVQWAQMMAIATQKYTRAAPVGATLGASAITIPAFQSVGAGVACFDDQSTSVPFPSSPISGRWYLLVLRRTWGLSPSAQHVWLLGSTGTGITATNPPRSLPATRLVQPGQVDDEPVLWFYYHSTAGSRRIVDASNQAGATAQTAAGLWDPAEQGFSDAHVLTNPLSVSDRNNRTAGRYRAHGGSWWDAGLNFYNYDQDLFADNPPIVLPPGIPSDWPWSLNVMGFMRQGDMAKIFVNVTKTNEALAPSAVGYISAAANRLLCELGGAASAFYAPRESVSMQDGVAGGRMGLGNFSNGRVELRQTVPGNITIGSAVGLYSDWYRCSVPRADLNLSNYPWLATS